MPSHLNQCCLFVNWTDGNTFQLNLIYKYSFRKMNLKMASARWWPLCASMCYCFIYSQYNHCVAKNLTVPDRLPLTFISMVYRRNQNILGEHFRFSKFNSAWQVLTHWGQNKMAAILQTTFSYAFSWMKMYEFRLRVHWSVFLRILLTIFQHWFR